MPEILDVRARGTRLFAVLLGVVWLALALPLALGQRTLVLRDVFTSHLPLKSFGAAELAAGRLPALQPDWALGQPYRGSPNALPFYPTNLLYLVLPFWSAFNLHYVLHWLIAFLGMQRLARAHGLSAEAALVAAITYAASGYLMTALTFMNLLTVAAWAPWTMLGLALEGRRPALLSGLACGMMLLGGEPLVAAMVVPLMLLVAVERHGWRGGLARAALVGGLGLVVALPQIVATLRILPFSFRGSHGLSSYQAVANDLHPFRLLELLLPMPWGWPADMRRFTFWAPRVTPHAPYIYSLHLGIVAFALALHAVRSRWRWAALAATFLFLAWALGLSERVTQVVTGGFFRYPQKLLFPFTIAGALLAGFGVERALAGRRSARAWLLGAVALAAVSVALFAAHDSFAALLRDHLVAARHEGVARTQAMHFAVLFAIAALLVGGAALALRRRSALGLLVAQAIGMLQMSTAWVTDSTEPYRKPPELVAGIGEPRTVAQISAHWPRWEPGAAYLIEGHDPVVQSRIRRADLEPAFLVFDRIAQVSAPDLEGLSSPLSVFLSNNMTLASWEVRLRWLRRMGAGWIVRNSAAPGPELPVVKTVKQAGVVTELYAISDTLPRASWPERLVVAKNPVDAWFAGANGALDGATAIASRPVRHEPGGAVRIVSENGDRIELDVDSRGGLAVIRRAYWPFLVARTAAGAPLATQPVELAMLGIEVPPGRHRIVVEVSSWPETVAAIVALVAVAAAALAARAGQGNGPRVVTTGPPDPR